MITETLLGKLLLQLNPWWDDIGFRFDLIPRSSFEFLKTRENKTIDILIGARRVGKTSIMQSVINYLLDSGINSKNIIYYSSDVRFGKEIIPEDIIEYVRSKFNIKNNNKLYLFLDEVQDMPDWPRSLKYLYDNTNIKIYITGSSSLILRPETSKLTGRFVLHEVLGLNFTEFLEFQNKSIFKQQKKNIELVTQYLETGGYPEYVLTRNSQELMNIIDSTLYRDLLSIYGIRNPSFLKDLLDYLADKVTNSVSNQNIAKDLKVNDDTAKFYLKYLQDVYLIYPLFKKGRSNKVTKSSVPKYYFNDTGVLNVRSSESKIGFLAENAVYLQLRRRSLSKEYPDIYYNEIDGVEVDFDNRANELKEVKFRNNLSVDDLIKYQTIDDKIDFIVQESSNEFYNVLPQHKQIPLWKFLSEDS